MSYRKHIHHTQAALLLTIGLALALFETALGATERNSGAMAADRWVLQPVNIIDVRSGAIAKDQAVHVKDGRISEITSADAAPEGVTVIDGDNGWLIPALAEMHAHVPSARRGEQATQDVLTLFLARGVTTIRGMLGEPGHLQLREELASGERLGPRLITSGPSFNGSSVRSVSQGVARVQEQVNAGYDFLKIHPGLQRDEFIAIAAEARRLNIPMAGHVSYETGLMTALAESQRSIDHLDAYAESMVPAESEMHGQAPQFFGLNLASAMDLSTIPALARATAEANVWQVPTQSLFETTVGPLSLEALGERPGMDLLGEELLSNWSDSVLNIRSEMSDAERTHFLLARRTLIKAMQEAGVGLLLGSDAPQIMNVPGYSVHQELQYLVDSGLTPLQALQSGTINVARFFDENDRGEVTTGHIADFVLLQHNPLDDIAHTQGILGVARAGHWHDKDTLSRWIEDVRSRGL